MTGSRRVLVLAPFPPRLDAPHGGGQAVARLVLALARRNTVALLFLRGPGEEPTDAAVSAACDLVCEVERRPVGFSLRTAWTERRRLLVLLRGRPLWVASVETREFRKRLDEIVATWRPDVVQVELGVLGGYLDRLPEGLLSILVEHEPGVRRGHNRVARAAWRRQLAASVRRARAIVVFTEQDALAVRAADVDADVEVIPLPWSSPSASSPVGTPPPTVLFVGSFAHAPNRAAARALLDALPALRRSRPDTVLALVGPSPPRDLVGAAGESVLVPGRVDDVRPWLDAAAVVAAPLDRGGGMRVKVLEALAAGKAVVASRLALEGIPVTAGEHVLVADSSEELVAALDALLGDPALRRRLGEAARDWAQGLPGPHEVAARYEALYDRLLPR
jgi:polysaccharide biosynthesis protein PslH